MFAGEINRTKYYLLFSGQKQVLLQDMINSNLYESNSVAVILALLKGDEEERFVIIENDDITDICVGLTQENTHEENLLIESVNTWKILIYKYLELPVAQKDILYNILSIYHVSSQIASKAFHRYESSEYQLIKDFAP